MFFFTLYYEIWFQKNRSDCRNINFTVLIIFLFEVFISSPKVINILNGFIPHKDIVTNHSVLYIALGIIGATIMPHNLYLHSSIVQSRKYDRTNENDKAQAIKYATIDSNIQLSIAFIVNCLLLVLGVQLFYGVNTDKLGGFYDLYHALKNSATSRISTWQYHEYIIRYCTTCIWTKFYNYWNTLGQIVMEGF